MNEAQFTTDELFDLKLACVWASKYWEELNTPKISKAEARIVAKHYRDMGSKLREMHKAQESSLATVEG